MNPVLWQPHGGAPPITPWVCAMGCIGAQDECLLEGWSGRETVYA